MDRWNSNGCVDQWIVGIGNRVKVVVLVVLCFAWSCMLHATRSAALLFSNQEGLSSRWEDFMGVDFKLLLPFFYINNGTLTGKDTIGQIERNNNNITIQ